MPLEEHNEAQRCYVLRFWLKHGSRKRRSLFVCRSLRVLRVGDRGGSTVKDYSGILPEVQSFFSPSAKTLEVCGELLRYTLLPWSRRRSQPSRSAEILKNPPHSMPLVFGFRAEARKVTTTFQLLNFWSSRASDKIHVVSPYLFAKVRLRCAQSAWYSVLSKLNVGKTMHSVRQKARFWDAWKFCL